MPTLEEIHAAYEKGEAAVVELFGRVAAQIEELAEQLKKQAEALKELQARLEKDSSNSSKPPSSDGYRKPEPKKRTESLRESGRKPNGGQPGHEGHTLKPLENPEYIEIHEVQSCKQCGKSLTDVAAAAHEERQVFDIPAMRIEVTAHRAEVKICPDCGAENRGEFPDEVTQPVQYGSGVNTWATYFPNQHYVSVERTAQIFEDLVQHRVSEATILASGKALAGYVEPAEEAVKEPLRQAEVINTDESGMRVKGKRHWLHVASNDKLTHYQIHAKRGKEAMDEAQVLPGFTGTMVHDHWKPYFRYEECSHALCNIHHLRELKFIEKQYGQAWATDMMELLLEIKKAVAETGKAAVSLSSERIEEFERRYGLIVNKGYEANPRPGLDENGDQPKKRGRPKQTPPLNLLDRFRDFKPQVLAFMYDSRVPFGNNQGEQDVRMMKVKQKVSGCFRTVEGGERFARIRGYISTARKNAVNAFDAIKNAFDGKPFIPSPENE
jgi:transposase